MRVRYDPEADILLIAVRDLAPVDAIEEPGGVIVSYGEDGEPVSVEFLNAARRSLVQAGLMDFSFHAGQTAQAGDGGP